jgi:hypothetical protein
MKITRRQLKRIISEELSSLNERVTPEMTEAKKSMYSEFVDWWNSLPDAAFNDYNNAQEAVFGAAVTKAEELQEKYNPGMYFDLAGDMKRAYDAHNKGDEVLASVLQKSVEESQ